MTCARCQTVLKTLFRGICKFKKMWQYCIIHAILC